MSGSITLPASDNGFFASEEHFDTSDVKLPSRLGSWCDSVGASMLDGAKRVVQEYNSTARSMWRSIEKLSKIKVDVPRYESCRQQLLNLASAVKD